MRKGVWLVLHLDAKKHGSMEGQLVGLAGRLGSLGVPVTYVFAREPARYPGLELRALGVDVRVLPFERPLEAARQLRRWLAAAPPALVHFHFVRAYSPLVAVTRLSGARVAVHDHVTLLPAHARLRGAAKHLRSQALNWMADLRIAVSEFVAGSVRAIDAVPPGHVTVVENGIDLDRFGRLDAQAARAALDAGPAPIIACVARLNNEKGVESAIRSVPVWERGAELWLVGEGPEAGRFRALAESLGVAGRVRFLGLRDDVDVILAAAHAVVVPSHWDEAFGLSVVEAMAASRPVVVTQSGAMPAIVGAMGLVVPRRDPAALAAAVNRLLADDSLASALGRAGRARAEERYSLPRYLDGLVAAYERLVPGLTAQSRAAA